MNCSDNYKELTERNIGILSEQQQEVLSKSCVCILGVGGLGGVASEILVRSGVGHVKLIDKDVFDTHNRNRQAFSSSDSLGKRKIDVAEQQLKNINPELKVEKYSNIDENNAKEIFENCNAAILAIDGIKGYLLASRESKKQNIPLIESWALPYANVRVFTKDTPTLEEAYCLPTAGKDLNQFSEEYIEKMHLKVLASLDQIGDVASFYSKDSLFKTLTGKIPPRSFCPMVWFNAVLMATEAIKVLTGIGKITLAPSWAVYDPFENKIPVPNLR